MGGKQGEIFSAAQKWGGGGEIWGEFSPELKNGGDGENNQFLNVLDRLFPFLAPQAKFFAFLSLFTV